VNQDEGNFTRASGELPKGNEGRCKKMERGVSGIDSLDPLDPVNNPRTRQAARSVVFVLDAERRPLARCHLARARHLLARHRAAVLRAQPFTLILRTHTDIPPETVQDPLQDVAAGAVVNPAQRVAEVAMASEHREAAEVPKGSHLTGTSTRAAVPSTPHSSAVALSPRFPPGQGYRLKIDPGSRTTGLALVQETRDSTGQAGQMGRVLWAAELTHRGDQVNERLTQRRQYRRSRRQRHTRYRPARYRNRRRREGWLPPPWRAGSRTSSPGSSGCGGGVLSTLSAWSWSNSIPSSSTTWRFAASSISKGHWPAMKFASTSWRIGAGVAPTANERTCPSRSST